MPEEFFKQLTAEQLITKVVRGYRRPQWVKTRERNEALDSRIYARAAAAQYGLDRFGERHWRALEQQVGGTDQNRREADHSTSEQEAIQPARLPTRRPAPTRRVIRSSFLGR